MLCLLCSAVFHLFHVHSLKVQALLARLDYCGISFLITGSSFPPLLYVFECNTGAKWAFVSSISFFCLLAFIFTLMPGADLPKYRKFRGYLFIVVGLLAGAPAVYTLLLE